MIEYIHDICARKIANRQPVISLEFFPPKTPENETQFFSRELPALMRINPDYCSVTCGTGGGARDRTLELAERFQRLHGLTTLCHLTCAHVTVSELRDEIAQAQQSGIKNILALRGDFLINGPQSQGEFKYAAQLVRFIKQNANFCVGVAGFPEGHPECLEGRQQDWDHLKAKIDCGASFVITQLFFNNEDFYRLRDHLENKGVTAPLFPGILPILSAGQIQRFAALCGAQVPTPLRDRLERHQGNDKACAEFGIDYATQQCADLLSHGVAGLHFYTLNKARSIIQVWRNLGLNTQCALG